MGYEPPCYIVQDKEAQYPDCCPEVTCPDSSETKSDNVNEYYSKFLEEDMNNELDSVMKNETAIKAQQPESFVDETYNDYFKKESRNKERQWRNANNDALDNNWVGQLLSEKQSISDLDLQQNNVIQEDDLFSRKVSPKFWYWFWMPCLAQRKKYYATV